MYHFYSHLKHLIATAEQIAVIINIITIGIIIFSTDCPKIADFSILKKSLATKNNELIDTKEYRAYIVTSTSNITIGSTGVTLNRFKICLLL